MLETVEQMGYAPNSVARNLRTRRSNKILVTVPDISNPFFSLILQGIEEAAQRAGYTVLLGDTQHEEKQEERYARMLGRKEADGLIFLGHRLPKAAAELVAAMAPRCAPVVQRLRIQSGARRRQRPYRQRRPPRRMPWSTSTASAIAASRWSRARW